jgi:SpoVK/Ycf46/Vps4 family AAA+-type ATPase
MLGAMNERIRAIVEEAQKLSPEERLELIDVLEVTAIGSDWGGTPEEIEAAWIEEVKRRMAQAERDGAEFIPAEDVIARLRQMLR